MKGGFEVNGTRAFRPEMIAGTLVPGHRFARLGRGNRHILPKLRSNGRQLAVGGCPDHRPVVFTQV
jgi:hypothetical protein